VTTLPDLWTKITEIQDREALQLVHRLVQSELTVLEAQLAQLQQVSRAIEEKMKGLDTPGTSAPKPTRRGKEGKS
jgi:hypothetical protein